MATCLYNGVPFPAMPEGDLANAFIYGISADGTTEAAVYTLIFASGTTPSYDANGIIFPYSSVGGKYTVVDGAWAEASEPSSDFYIKRDNLIFTLWANFDVLDSDGSVYVAASEPECSGEPGDDSGGGNTGSQTIAEARREAFMQGMATMAALYSRMLEKRTPVAQPERYMYNEYDAPPLPDAVDGYPYTYLCIGLFSRILILSDTELIYYGDLKFGPPEGKTAQIIQYIDSYGFKDGWGESSTQTVQGTYSYEPVWTNHDVLDQDGTVYLAASEPVPIYE